MNTQRTALFVLFLTMPTVFILTSTTPAQPSRARQPQVVSPDVSSDRHVTFRILAPKAEAVLVSGSDIPDVGRGVAMTKDANGVW